MNNYMLLIMAAFLIVFMMWSSRSRRQQMQKLEQEKLKKERKSRNDMGRTAPRKAAKNEPRFEEVPRQRTRKKPRARAK